MAIRRQEWAASLIAAAAAIWIVQCATTSRLPLYGLVFPAGPLETSCTAILVWLHAKWRRVRDTNRQRGRVSLFLPAN